jgi:phosphodiesterase/alkaline phosphatase D-like protein
MTKNTGFPHSFFDDIDFFDFLPSRDRDDRDDDGHGHHDHKGNEQISPLPYDAAAFPDGVSSGDVTQTSAVLWARAGHTGRVTFQVATDAAFHHIVDVVTVNVNDPLVPAKVEVDNLHPDQRYYYRAVDAGGHVGEGTLETSARLGHHEGFSFGVGGDTRGELAPYPSIKNAPTAGLDLFIKLGDTAYGRPAFTRRGASPNAAGIRDQAQRGLQQSSRC